MEPGTFATNVWASAWRPDEMRHVPLDRGVLLFLSGWWNMRTQRQESAYLAAALPSTNLGDGESTQTACSRTTQHEKYEYAPAYSEGPVVPTDYRWPSGACPDPTTGRDAGEEDYIQRTAPCPAT